MRLDDVTIALRARTQWEAVDLGATMLRAWWRPVYGAWFAVVLPLAVVLHVVFAEHAWLALLLLWWLKPFYDRVVLHVLAQAVFGAPPRVGETLARLPAIVRSSGLAGGLTWRRLDPVRSFNLPVRQLELQSGKQARARERLLGRRAAGQATGLLYACLTFELILILSLHLCRDLVTPAAVPSTLTFESFFRDLFGFDETPAAAIMQNAFALAAMAVVEPLYVASGFSLYLNRRTALEAWDLELAFRRMAQDGPADARSPAAAVAVCALAALLFAPAQQAWAGEPPPDSRTLIREVLAAPEFEEFRKDKVWQPRNAQPRSRADKPDTTLAEILAAIARTLSDLSRLGAYVALAVFLVFALRFLIRAAARWESGKAKAEPDGPAPPRTLFGLDVSLESLPADLAGLAAQAADRDPRFALSLLYRGALATLMHRDRVPIDAGDTEGDCLQRVQRLQAADLAAYFGRLVGAWSQTAYAGRAPDISAVRSLCEDWPRHFARDTVRPA